MKKILFLLFVAPLFLCSAYAIDNSANTEKSIAELEREIENCLNDRISKSDLQQLRSIFESNYSNGSITDVDDPKAKQYQDIVAYISSPTKTYPEFRDLASVVKIADEIALEKEEIKEKGQLDCLLKICMENIDVLDSTQSIAGFAEILATIKQVPNISPGLIAGGLEVAMKKEDYGKEFYQNAITLLFVFDYLAYLPRDRTAEIDTHINNLLIEEERGNAVMSVFNVSEENIGYLIPFEKKLSETISHVITTDDFDYLTCNLALVLSYRGMTIIDPNSELALVQQNKEIRSKLIQSQDYHKYIYNDSYYMNYREDTEVILELLGYGTTAESLEELRASLDFFDDNIPKCFAAMSLINRNEKVPANEIYTMAEDLETRGFLFQYLSELNRLELFPKDFNNQKSLSESDMVNWLLYASVVPTEIEFIELVTITDLGDDKPLDYYLWKFKSDDIDLKSNGWMVGLSGGFLRSETPTVNTFENTYSTYTKLNDKTPEEHFQQLLRDSRQGY